MHLRRILFPIDFSPAAEAMAPSVRELAQRFNASVTVLNAFNAVPEYIHGPALGDAFGADGAPIPYSPVLLELREEREHRLKEFAQAHFSGIGHTQKVEDGDPAMVIKWAAEQEETDLIMMPTQGLGRFRRLLLGSVTAKILHDIACPVWTSAHEPDPASKALSGCRSVLCAVELNEEAAGVFDAAVVFARAYGAKVCLLNIQSPSDAPGSQASAESIRVAFDRACDAGEKGIAVDAHVRTMDAAIAEGIRQTAREEGADLVIVGRGHARETFSRAWSHLYTIIRESPCPVLSV
ncbi:MAG: universal stress protein [Terracidiphilus sp.]